METNNDLKAFYKHVYSCEKCGVEYGSDKKERKKHVCPICEGKFKR